jgi:excisionase family DNA binding protein
VVDTIIELLEVDLEPLSRLLLRLPVDTLTLPARERQLCFPTAVGTLPDRALTVSASCRHDISRSSFAPDPNYLRRISRRLVVLSVSWNILHLYIMLAFRISWESTLGHTLGSTGMEYLTVSEVAKRLKVTPLTVRRWLNAGSLAGIQLGDRAGWRITETDLQTFLDSRRRGGVQDRAERKNPET